MRPWQIVLPEPFAYQYNIHRDGLAIEEDSISIFQRAPCREYVEY